jgi:hypothetical protein
MTNLRSESSRSYRVYLLSCYEELYTSRQEDVLTSDYTFHPHVLEEDMTHNIRFLAFSICWEQDVWWQSASKINNTDVITDDIRVDFPWLTATLQLGIAFLICCFAGIFWYPYFFYTFCLILSFCSAYFLRASSHVTVQSAALFDLKAFWILPSQCLFCLHLTFLIEVTSPKIASTNWTL